MSESFPYEIFWNDPRPEISWDTPDGLWVGHWKYGWYDQIGDEVLKLTDEFEYEVWQPDLRADKIYTYAYNKNLSHKLFPAEIKRKLYGLKKITYVTSKSIMENLITESTKNRLIIHLDGINPGISREVLDLNLNCPIVVQFLGEVRHPLKNLLRLRKNVMAKINDVSEHFVLKKLFKKATIVLFINEKGQSNLMKYSMNEKILLPIGIDFNYWKRKSEKEYIRKALGFKNNSLILLSSSRLNSSKQVDKMILVLKKLDNNYDFQYIVTGHGEQQYEKYLTHLGENLIRKGKLKFVGYLPEEKLIDYYNAADLFVITSLCEGAPVAAIKAAAMEIPIFSTDTGFVAEQLSRYDVGIVVPLKDYRNWELKLKEFFSGQEITIMQREIAESVFHWPNVAARYLIMYKKLYATYYQG